MKKKNIFLPLILLILCFGISYWVYLSYNKYSLPSQKVQNNEVKVIIEEPNNDEVKGIIDEPNNDGTEIEEKKEVVSEQTTQNKNSEVLIYNIKDGEDFQSASVSLKRLMLKNNYDYNAYKNRVIFVVENGTKEMTWKRAKDIYFKKKQPSNGDYFLFQKFDIPTSCTESQKKQSEKYIKNNWNPPKKNEDDTQFCKEWYDYLIKISKERAQVN